MEEVLEKIKEFLEKKNTELETITLEDDNGKLAYEIWLKDPLELSEEEYNKLGKLITGSKFSLIDSWETIEDDTYERKSYLGVDEYQNNEDVEVSVFYTRIWTNKNMYYFIDKVWIE